MYVGGGRSGYELTARQATARVDGSHLSFVRGVLCARTLAPFMRAVFVQRQPAGNVAQQRARVARAYDSYSTSMTPLHSCAPRRRRA
jgi:hypothetical protein